MLTTNDNIIDVYIDENFQWFNHFYMIAKKFVLHYFLALVLNEILSHSCAQTNTV